MGAAAGSLLTIHFGNRVIWFCCASLLVSLSFMFIREDIEENPELQREAAALHQDVKAMEHTIGKTFTMANVIARCNRPTLILEPNKTLAAQLCTEMRAFFPEDAVEYFVVHMWYTFSLSCTKVRHIISN